MTIDYHSLLDIAFRSSCVYIFMILAFRIFGKRELSQLSIADLALVVLISNAVQNAMLGFLMFRFKGFRSLVQSEPVTLIYEGKIIPKNMKEVLLSDDELMAAVREHGVEKISDVSLAIMEVDGNISIISGNDKHLVRTQYRRKRRHKTMQDM